ncbi:MobA/MobL family protein [Bradyrhizobium sp. CSA207]|uniref:MobA/MobL family protein n=1 Tax=Bradyrhizobium sp. CSA207 TaxID=2698826 RepID=UPI0023B0486B|nr:MobA/MobL family protein [Bradyrhizobium sp. CSA207]MDE5441081.1 MobA/MobL family protein [Bradyrhizobium sp. CSA207]
MAIYSLHHTPVGKSTQAQPYTAAAHIRYITRKDALSDIRQARFPARTPREIADYLRGCEDRDRKNARVLDKVMLALPRELTEEQRIGLVKDFAEHVTKGKAPWLAAFHTKGKDARNPHCHLVIRDRDPSTNKRVIGTSEIGSTERLRRQWEDYANRALSRAGHKERIDRRTLEAQGIQREPTIHEGPQAQAMDRRGARPDSRSRRRRNRPGSRRSHRDVDYRKIDKGRSRPEVNRARRAGGRETERDYWDAVDADNQRREISALRGIHNPHRAEPVEEPRRIRPSFRALKHAPRDGRPRDDDGKVVNMADHKREKDRSRQRQGVLPLGQGGETESADIKAARNGEREGPGLTRKTFSQMREAEKGPHRPPPQQGQPTFSERLASKGATRPTAKPAAARYRSSKPGRVKPDRAEDHTPER